MGKSLEKYYRALDFVIIKELENSLAKIQKIWHNMEQSTVHISLMDIERKKCSLDR